MSAETDLILDMQASFRRWRQKFTTLATVHAVGAGTVDVTDGSVVKTIARARNMAVSPGDQVLVLRVGDAPTAICVVARKGEPDSGETGGSAGSHTHTIESVFGLSEKLDTYDLDITILSGMVGDLQTNKADLTYVNSQDLSLATSIDGKANLVHNHDASAITSGTLATARLGTGTPDSTKYLRGDGTWQPFPTSLPPGAHTHAIADITGLQAELDDKVSLTGLDWTVVTSALSTAQNDINALESGKADLTYVNSQDLSLATSIDGKANAVHTHAAADVTSGTFADARIPNLAASKITSGTFAAARLGSGTANSSAYLRGDLTWQPFPTSLPPGAHTHPISEITGLQAELDGKVSSVDYAADQFTHATTHTNLQTQIDGKANASHNHAASAITSGVIAVARLGTGTPSASTYLRGDGAWTTFPTSLPPGAHTHPISEITGLQSDLDDISFDITILSAAVADLQTNKADASHTHAASAITSGTFAAARLGSGTANSSKYLRGDLTWVDFPSSLPPGAHTHPIADIQATGTPSSSTYLRGDGTWSTPANTTYSLITQAEAENSASTTARLVSGQRLAQAIAVHPPAAHTHAIANITGLQAALDDKVSLTGLDWTVVTSSLSTAQNDIDALETAVAGKANTSHTHAAGDVTSGTFADARIPSLAASKITSGTFAAARLGSGTADSTKYLRGDMTWQTFPTSLPPGPHSHAISEITGLQDALDAKTDNSVHNLLAAVVTTLDGDLDDLTTVVAGKANASHTHHVDDLTATGTKSSTTYLRGDNTWATPPNTTYVTVSQAEAEAGTATTARVWTAERVKQAILALSPVQPGHTHAWADITGKPTTFTPAAHTHAASDITSGVLATARLGTGTANSSVFLRGDGTWAAVGVGSHSHAISDVTGLQAALDAKTDTSVHNLLAAVVTTQGNDIDALETAVAGKANASHTHHVDDMTATGTKSSTTYLRGDNTWATPPNTTYSTVSQAEAEAGTATTARVWTAQRVAQAIAALSPVQPGHTHAWADITGKPTTFAPSAHNHDASEITSGTFAAARLGSGTANSSVFLRGDLTWAAVSVGSHSHAISDITGLQAALDDKVDDDLNYSIWKAGVDAHTSSTANPHNVTIAQIGAAAASHTHPVGDINATGTPSSSTYLRGDGTWATPTNTTYSVMSQAEAEAGTATTARTMSAARLKATILYYASAGAHTHPISDIVDLQTALDGKVDNDLNYSIWKAGVDAHTASTANPHNVTAAQVGAALASHTHHINDLTATGTKSSSTFLRGDNTWATPPNTTYSTISQAEAENPASTTARLVTGQRMRQAIDKTKFTARLSSNHTTTSTTPAAVTGLNMPIGANERWHVTYVLPIGTGGAGGLDLGISAPAGATITAGLTATDGGVGTALVVDMLIILGQFGTAIGKDAYGFSIASGFAKIDMIVTNGGTAGTVSLMLKSMTAGQTSAVGTGGAVVAHLMP